MFLLCLILFYCCFFNLQSKRMQNAGSARNNWLDITIFYNSLAHALNGFHFESNMTLSGAVRVCVCFFCVSFLCKCSPSFNFTIQYELPVQSKRHCTLSHVEFQSIKNVDYQSCCKALVWSLKANPYVQHIHHCISVWNFCFSSFDHMKRILNSSNRYGCENAFRE